MTAIERWRNVVARAPVAGDARRSGESPAGASGPHRVAGARHGGSFEVGVRQQRGQAVAIERPVVGRPASPVEIIVEGPSDPRPGAGVVALVEVAVGPVEGDLRRLIEVRILPFVHRSDTRSLQTLFRAIGHGRIAVDLTKQITDLNGAEHRHSKAKDAEVDIFPGGVGGGARAVVGECSIVFIAGS